MSATEDLRHEHRAVERMLTILERMTAHSLIARDAAALAESLEFLRVFVDTCHHYKEEELLFPALLGEGVEGAHEQIDQLLQEHQQGRALVSAIGGDLELAGHGDVAALAAIEAVLFEYTALLRAHIASEEAGVFALADIALTEPVQETLAEGYENVERDVIGEGKHEAFHEMLDRLEAESS